MFGREKAALEPKIAEAVSEAIRVIKETGIEIRQAEPSVIEVRIPPNVPKNIPEVTLTITAHPDFDNPKTVSYTVELAVRKRPARVIRSDFSLPEVKSAIQQVLQGERDLIGYIPEKEQKPEPPKGKTVGQKERTTEQREPARPPTEQIVLESIDELKIPVRELPLERPDWRATLDERLRANSDFLPELSVRVERLNDDARKQELVDPRIITSGEPLQDTGTRQKDVAHLRSLSAPGKPTLLTSTYRAGVTTLLKMLGKEYAEHRHVEQTGDNFYYGAIGLHSESKNPVSDIAEWNEKLRTQNEQGLFTTSEAAVTGTFDTAAGQRFLDHLANLSNVTVIVHEQSTAKRANTIPERYKGFHQEFVPPLSLEDAVTYMGETLSASGRVFSPETAQAIYAATGGRAFELSSLLNELTAAKQGRELTVDDVTTYHEAFRDAAADRNKRSQTIRGLFQFVYDRMQSYLDTHELSALKKLAEGEQIEMSESLANLVMLGFVTQDQGTFQVNGKLLKETLVSS